jgi:hypothetical protein
LNVHDKRPIAAFHQDVKSERKPDIIATSREDSNDMYNQSRDECWDDARKTASNPSRMVQSAIWSLVLSIFELKVKQKYISVTPPSQYSVEMQSELAPQEVPGLEEIFERKDVEIPPPPKATNSRSKKSGEVDHRLVQDPPH